MNISTVKRDKIGRFADDCNFDTRERPRWSDKQPVWFWSGCPGLDHNQWQAFLLGFGLVPVPLYIWYIRRKLETVLFPWSITDEDDGKFTHSCRPRVGIMTVNVVYMSRLVLKPFLQSCADECPCMGIEHANFYPLSPSVARSFTSLMTVGAVEN